MPVSNKNRAFTAQLLIILLEWRMMCPFFLQARVYKIDVPHALLPFLPGSHCEGESQCGDTQQTGRWVAFQHNHSIAVHWVLHSLSSTGYLEENMHLKPPNYLPVSLVPLSFPWHIGTMGLFALTSGRICSVNLSQPNLNFSKKASKDIGSGNSIRDKNKISSQKSHFHKLPA